MGILYWKVTAYEEGRSFKFIHTAGGLKGSIAFFLVEPDKHGSRVHVQMRMSGPFIMRLMIFLMGGKMRKGVREDLQKLKELMESEFSSLSFSTETTNTSKT